MNVEDWFLLAFYVAVMMAVLILVRCVVVVGMMIWNIFVTIARKRGVRGLKKLNWEEWV